MTLPNTPTPAGHFTRRVRNAASMCMARCGLSVAFVLCLASVSLCCSIPVFRYALEHWHPELFLVHIISTSPLDPEQQLLVQELEAASANANVRCVVSDGTGLASAECRAIADKAKAMNKVWLAVESTKKSGTSKQLVWDAPFTKESTSQLLTSPLRDRVCEGLVDKDSVAWVFLESGKPELDDAKFSKLESELRRLDGVIKLPVIEEADLKDLSKRPEELTVKFSAHRLSRSDPREAAFISMLLATESDLQEEFDSATPMAFPIFGRGRVLYALLGDGIATSTIEEACRFLAGACQCTVKTDNPGVDLLVAFDWDSHVQITDPKKADDLPFTGLGSFAKSAAMPTPKSDSGKSTTERAEQSTSLNANERVMKSEAKEFVEAKTEGIQESNFADSKSAKKTTMNVDSELAYALPAPTSTPYSTLLTLGVLTAIVGIATVSWKFLSGTRL